MVHLLQFFLQIHSLDLRLFYFLNLDQEIEKRIDALPLDKQIKLTSEGRLRLDGLILELIKELESSENIFFQFD